MFSGDSPIPLSVDSVKFCMVMSVFDNYERTVSASLILYMYTSGPDSFLVYTLAWVD